MGVSFPGEKHYEGVQFNVISITRGWGGGQISKKKALRNTWMAPVYRYSIAGVSAHDFDGCDFSMDEMGGCSSNGKCMDGCGLRDDDMERSSSAVAQQ